MCCREQKACTVHRWGHTTDLFAPTPCPHVSAASPCWRSCLRPSSSRRAGRTSTSCAPSCASSPLWVRGSCGSTGLGDGSLRGQLCLVSLQAPCRKWRGPDTLRRHLPPPPAPRQDDRAGGARVPAAAERAAVGCVQEPHAAGLQPLPLRVGGSPCAVSGWGGAAGARAVSESRQGGPLRRARTAYWASPSVAHACVCTLLMCTLPPPVVRAAGTAVRPTPVPWRSTRRSCSRPSRCGGRLEAARPLRRV